MAEAFQKLWCFFGSARPGEPRKEGLGETPHSWQPAARLKGQGPWRTCGRREGLAPQPEEQGRENGVRRGWRTAGLARGYGAKTEWYFVYDASLQLGMAPTGGWERTRAPREA